MRRAPYALLGGLLILAATAIPSPAAAQEIYLLGVLPASTGDRHPPPTHDLDPDENCITNVSQDSWGHDQDLCVGHRETSWTDCYGVWTRTHGNGPDPTETRDDGTYVCNFYDCDIYTDGYCGTAVCSATDTKRPDGVVRSSGECTGVIGDCLGYKWAATGQENGTGGVDWTYAQGYPVCTIGPII